MSYTSVLVPFHLDSDSGGLLRTASGFATRFDAWQIGLAAGQSSLPYFAEGPVGGDLIKQMRVDLIRKFNTVERAFREINAARKDRIEFRCMERVPDEVVIPATVAADLVMVERNSGMVNLMHGVDIGNLLMQSGRPILVVPPAAERFTADKIVVAWKNTREARRAVLDALPLLRLANAISVLEIQEPDDKGSDATTGAAGVAAWLQRHGLNAKPLVSRESGDAGELIDDHALGLGADLIVAGGYGTNRLLQWLFGGVTRHLLWRSRFPVLFSH